MPKLIDLPLKELYERPRITGAVEEAIIQKEDFSKIQPMYCQTICKLKCKQYNDLEVVKLQEKPVDVLIIQDHLALPDTKYGKTSFRIEHVNQTIIRGIISKTFEKTTSYKISNLLKCGVTEQDMVKGKAPSASVLLKCKPYLLSEIERYKPKVIISLTTTVTKALGLKKANTSNRGEIHYLESGIPVVITLHPKLTTMIRQNASGAMWGPDYWGVILRDFQKARSLLDKRLRPKGLDHGLSNAKQRIFICTSIEAVKRAANELLKMGNTQTLSFDTETTGLDPWAPDAKLLTIQFGFKAPDGIYASIVVPLWHRKNKQYDAAEAWKMMEPILTSPNIKKVGHNAKFDILYIYATTGCRVQGLAYDTMLVLHNINSGIQGNYGLKMAVWDWIPETDLGGYEERLPKLSKDINDLVEEGEQGDSDS